MKTGLALTYTWSSSSEVDSSQFSFLPGSCWLACLCGRSALGVCRPGRHHQSHSCSSPERSYRPASPYRTPPADLPGHTHYFSTLLKRLYINHGNLSLSVIPRLSLPPPSLLNASGLFLRHIAFSLPRLTVCEQFVEPFQTTILKTALSTLSGTAFTEAYMHMHTQSECTHRYAAPAPKRKTCGPMRVLKGLNKRK